MAMTIITPALGATDITFNSVSRADTLNFVSFRSTAPQEDLTVFSNEDTGGDYDLGTPVNQIDVRGFLAFDAAGTNPFLPLSDWRDKPFEITYATDVSVSGNCTFFDATVPRTAGTTSVYSASARTNGAITIAWSGDEPSSS